MNTDLPPGQTRILQYFADAEDAGRQPSRAEVAQAMGYAFPSAVSKHVEALVRKGLFVADRDKKRNVRLTDNGWKSIGRAPAHRGVPVLGAIAAGAPISAIEHASDFIKDITPMPGRFALKVRGDSMIEAGILDGDFAVIQQDGQVAENQIAAVVVEGEATLKRVRRIGSDLVLFPENRTYQPITVTPDRAAATRIVGPLLFIYRTVR